MGYLAWGFFVKKRFSFFLKSSCLGQCTCDVWKLSRTWTTKPNLHILTTCSWQSSWITCSNWCPRRHTTTLQVTWSWSARLLFWRPPSWNFWWHCQKRCLPALLHITFVQNVWNQYWRFGLSTQSHTRARAHRLVTGNMVEKKDLSHEGKTSSQGKHEHKNIWPTLSWYEGGIEDYNIRYTRPTETWELRHNKYMAQQRQQYNNQHVITNSFWTCVIIFISLTSSDSPSPQLSHAQGSAVLGTTTCNTIIEHAFMFVSFVLCLYVCTCACEANVIRMCTGRKKVPSTTHPISCLLAQTPYLYIPLWAWAWCTNTPKQTGWPAWESRFEPTTYFLSK